MNVAATIISALIAGIVAVLVALLGGRISDRASRRSTAIDERRVSLDEFNAHKDFMKGQIDDLRADLTRTTLELHAEKAWSMFLEQFLREHSMPVPQRPPVVQL